jgi:hypothetical protein
MEILFGVIPLNDSHNRSFSHDLHLIIGQPGNNRKGYDDPAARKTIPAGGEPCASCCQCSRHGVRSPDSCIQNLYIQHVKKSAASRHSQRLLRTRRRPPPVCWRPEQIRRCCQWDQTPASAQELILLIDSGSCTSQIARHCVHVGVDSRFSETAKILLRISVVTVGFPQQANG